MRQYVGVILVKPDGSVLAQHRDNNPDILGSNTWSVVGGALEEGESPEKGAARELLEETGYAVNGKNLRLLIRDEYVTERGVPIQRIIFWDKFNEKQQINCYEGQEIRFLGRDELETLIVYNGHKDFLKKASVQALNDGGYSL